MDVDRLLAELRRQGRELVDAAVAAGLDAVVPTCPGWQVRDLLGHAGYVHRWATAHVAGPLTEPLDETAADRAVGPIPDGSALYDWYADGHAALVETLAAAPDDTACWSFLPAPTPLAFWVRRQAHECAVHRADADRAAQRRTSYDPEFAADGIDELLTGFLARRRGGLVSDPPLSLAVVATGGPLTGTPVAWHVTIGADARTVRRESRPADCTLRGPASELYKLLWNRLTPAEADIDIDGDHSVLDLFAAKAQVRWS